MSEAMSTISRGPLTTAHAFLGTRAPVAAR